MFLFQFLYSFGDVGAGATDGGDGVCAGVGLFMMQFLFILFLRRNQSDQGFVIVIEPSLFLSFKGWEGGGGGLKDGGDVGLVDVGVAV